MADLDDESQRKMTCLYDELTGSGFDGTQTHGLPYHISLAFFSLENYAFVGDALYSRFRDGCFVFNATLLKDEIEVLKRLKAPNLLVSHTPGLVRTRVEVLEEMEELYHSREKGNPEIKVRKE